MFDGKKVKRGGDVDLLGFEGDNTLNDRIAEKENKERILKDSVEIISSVQKETKLIADTPEQLKTKVFNCLLSILMLFSVIIKGLKALRVKKTISLENLKKKCNDQNWQNSKYAYNIDLCRTAIWRIQNTVDKALSIIKCVCKAGAFLNGKHEFFAKADLINLNEQGNVKILKWPNQLSEEPTDTSVIKQRTTQWESERKKVKVTGSSVYQAIGCDSLKRQKQHFDKVMYNIEPPDFSEEQKIAMKHGQESEIHQIATLSSMIMPFLFPDQVFFEEGFYVQDNMVVSPDGSLQSSDKKTANYAFEGKAPMEKSYATQLHYEVPERYIAQTLFEQRVLKARNGTLYMSWSPESCTLFKVSPNEDTCKHILEEVNKIFSSTSGKPSRVSDAAKQIKEEFKMIAGECEFLGEFPSVKGFLPEALLTADKDNPSPFRCTRPTSTTDLDYSYDEVLRHLHLGKEVLTDAYEIQRPIASQVIVFLLADLDRLWKAEEPHAIPVAYLFRGYSLSMDITRQINERCKLLCRNNGLDVIATAADSEFYNLMVRGNNNRPLTQHQLSKDIWSEVSKPSKAEIINRMKDKTKNYVVTYEITNISESDDIFPSRGVNTRDMDLIRIRTPSNGWKTNKQKDNEPNVVLETERSEGVESRENMDIASDSPENMGTPSVSNTDDIQEDGDNTILYEVGEEMYYETHENSELLQNNIPGILSALQELDKKKWSNVNQTSLTAYFESAMSLRKFTVKELQAITRYINLRQTDDASKLKVSGRNKSELINQLSLKLGDGSKVVHKPRGHTKVLSLQVLSQRAVMKKTYPKSVINIAYCNYIWPERKCKWLREAHVHDRITIVGLDEDLIPYYVPDFQNESGDFEVSVYDKTHLGSNLRKAICLDNVNGVSKSAWIKVAESDPSILNKSLIDVSEDGKILDQMKEKIARSLFTEEVESVMLENGYVKEAAFCKIIREGLYEAEDEPGISATDRCKMRLNLIKWLNKDVEFGQFPPYGGKIKGLSHVLYEGLRCSNEAKLYLYALSRTGTYCARAPNTLCSESFFSTMQEMDPWGQGVLTTAGVKKHISDFTTVTALKMKSDKHFYIRTKKDAAYPVPETYNNSNPSDDQSSISDDQSSLLGSQVCNCREVRYLKCVIPRTISSMWKLRKVMVRHCGQRFSSVSDHSVCVQVKFVKNLIGHARDHFFDTEARARRSYKVKPFKFSGINEPARGDLPIRAQYGYRINEVRVFHSDRMGVKLQTD